ncbi:hypothetical protein PMF13cell1_03871 [Blautia producta]|uniref:ABC3 transporter permease C-terminal domain-containing protein n=1 Tax=Blautia producta TaxID=33035 RepID=A0A4P6M2K1_9FIRM|nr:FtsX-like permease family protein [Blautia producta]QBE98305.1 hypothetical protein PMF13cell1_03871 [Blautia producta]
MNTINRTALSNLRQNKGRNIMAGIAIFLTTILVFVIPVIGLGAVDLEIAAANKIYPTFHVMYRNVSAATAEELSHRAEVESIGLRQDPAQIPVQDGTGWMVYMDETALKLNKMELDEGTFPKKRNEIVVSDNLLKALGITGGIGDTIELSYQPVEPDGIGYEKKQNFVITGLLPTTAGSEDSKVYSAIVSKDFMEQEQPENMRRYRVLLRIANADSMNTVQIEETYNRIAKEAGISEANVVDNHTYLAANYIDPALYTGIAGILLVVVLAGIMTIYSLYYITMVYKVQEFGKIKALGATKRQIRQIVFREGILVALMAIPAGLIAGSIAASIGYRFLTSAYGAENPITPVIMEMIKNHEVSLLKPWMYVMAAAVALLTVVFALLRPMQIAAKISPVEAMRYDGSMKSKKKQRKGHSEMNLFRLTGANLSRNKKRTVMTIVTLSLTGILFMVISTLLSCAEPEEIARDTIFDDFQISVDSSSGDKMHPELEWSVLCKNNPLNEDFEKQVLDIPGVEKVTRTSLMEVELPDHMDGDETWKTSIIGIPEEYAGRMEKSIIQGSCTYEDLQQGDKILIDQNMQYFMPDVEIGDTLRVAVQSGNRLEEKEFEIAAVADMPYGLSHYTFLALPNSVIRQLTELDMDYYWSVEVDHKELHSAEQQLQTLLEENDLLEMKSYEEEVAYNKKNTSFMAQLCYIFMIVLGGVGIMNLINTMVNSIYVRRRELGIMQAIGLSEKQLVRMLQLEGIFYTAGTLFFSLGIGSLLGYVTFLYAKSRRMFGILGYHYPTVQTAVLIAVILTIQILLTYLIMKNFRKQSMIERIRFSE